MISQKAQSFKVTLLAITDETAQVKTFTLGLDKDLKFIPGQYVMLELPGLPKRPFSILDYEPQGKKLKLGIKKRGAVTNVLWTMSVGEGLIIKGPYGRFCAEDEKIVCVAGGIGITPIYNILLNRNTSEDFLFYSSPSEEQMPYIDSISKLNKVKTQLYFTQVASNKGQNKRIVGKDVVAELVEANNYSFFICGPQKMIEGIRHDLQESGINSEKIRTEAF